MPDREQIVTELKWILEGDRFGFGENWETGEPMDEYEKAGKIITDTITLLEEQESVVRCKDCKYWAGNGADIDELPHWLPCKGEMRQPDYFCADGERKESR